MSFKRFYRRLDAFLCRNILLKRIIQWQHARYPLPLPVFNWIFAARWRKKLLNFYGSHCFETHYHVRQGQESYWLSRESLYWHFWRQTDMDQELLHDIFSRPDVQALFQQGDYTCLEVGFGIGKNYKYWLRENNRLKKYIALELNPYACEHSREMFPEKNLEVCNQSLDDFIGEKKTCDIIFVANGVFMYCPLDVMERFFQYLNDSAVKALIIWNEGSTGNDIVREDGTIMYGFENRLRDAGITGQICKQPQELNPQFLKYFIMTNNR